jgi:hypothetical protein
MKKHWMFRCDKVSHKVSEALDHPLPWQQRLMVRVHLMMCRYCSRFQRQLLLIRELARRVDPTEDELADQPGLSPDSRDRILRSIRSAAGRV